MDKPLNRLNRREAPRWNRYLANFNDEVSLVLSARTGLNATAFFDLVSIAGYEKERLARFYNLSLKTFQRYEQENKKLDPSVSELTLKFMALFKKGGTW